MERTIEEQAKRYASSEIESGGLCGLNGIDASKYQPFIDGANWIKSLLLEKLQVYKGAMILDGYEPEDACIKFMNELIEEINEGKYSSWISVEKRLPKPGVEVLLFDKDSIRHYVTGWLREKKEDHKSMWVLSNGFAEDKNITHWMYIPELLK